MLCYKNILLSTLEPPRPSEFCTDTHRPRPQDWHKRQAAPVTTTFLVPVPTHISLCPGYCHQRRGVATAVMSQYTEFVWYEQLDILSPHQHGRDKLLANMVTLSIVGIHNRGHLSISSWLRRQMGPKRPRPEADVQIATEYVRPAVMV